EEKLIGDLWVCCPRATAGAHGDAAHALYTAAYDGVAHPAHHACCGEVYGDEARGAETVQLHAGNGLIVVCVQRGDTRDVSALFSDRFDAAQEDVIDLRCVELVAITERFERCARQVD